MNVVDLLTLAVLAYVGVRLAEAARASVRTRRSWELARGVRLRHVLGAIPALAAVIGAFYVLWYVPVLRWGWWTALGGQGNPVFGSTSSTSGTALSWLVPAVFAVLLVVGLPLLVEREEEVFRRGAERRGAWGNARRSVEFGLAHALVGIPIGAALALSIGGFYLTHCYLRGWRHSGTEADALAESARAHLAYNGVILALVGVALLSGL